MSLDTLITGIQSEAQAEAGRILAQAKAEAQRLLEEADRATRAAADREQQREVDRCRREASQRVSQARLAARNRLLDVEQELVDDVLARILQLLRDMDDDDYRAWMKRQVLACVRAADERVVVSLQDHHRLTQRWREDVERALHRRCGIDALHLEFVDRDLGGGFVIRHPKYDVDVTFGELLRSLEEQRRGEIARLLFEE